MRAAIYFAPSPDTALAQAAARWLGRDAFAGAPARERDPQIDALVSEPARYGFHATFKAPFRLADGHTLEELAADLDAFASSLPALAVPRLELARLGPFFALVPGEPVPALHGLEADLLRRFEAFRAPLAQAEIERRQPQRLTPRQRELLERWGYPHVLDEFRFHMTLTGPVPPAGFPRLEEMLAARFAAFIGRPLAVGALALFVEPEPGAPFTVRSTHAFRMLSPAEPA